MRNLDRVATVLAMARIAVASSNSGASPGSLQRNAVWRTAWRAVGALQPLAWSPMLVGDERSDERLRGRMAACATRLVFGQAGPLRATARARAVGTLSSAATAPELVKLI